MQNMKVLYPGKNLGSVEWFPELSPAATHAADVASMCYGKDRAKNPEKLTRFLVEREHTSPLEFITYQFRITCPLFVRSQWHRHRTWSFNEISRRYTESNIQFYSKFGDEEGCPEVRNIFEEHNRSSLKAYDRLVDMGVPLEDARAVLPQATLTQFWAAVDGNNIRKFLKLRTDADHAQWEIVQFANAIVELLAEGGHTAIVADFMKNQTL